MDIPLNSYIVQVEDFLRYKVSKSIVVKTTPFKTRVERQKLPIIWLVEIERLLRLHLMLFFDTRH